MSEQDVEKSRRRFLLGSVAVLGGVGAGFAAIPFVSSFQPSARARAVGAPVEIDISKLEPGQRVIHQWRGQPVWVVRRTTTMMEALERTDALADPESQQVDQQPTYAVNASRSIKPEILVMIGLCTHLGCSPTFVPAESGAEFQLGSDWAGGFFCPCHGSRFDLAGRVFAGYPAPSNMRVPPHRYLSETRILIGEDQRSDA
ncbi:MAG: ubiquinol-cytochrome c reductase iron-sulfur subunit [Gammaproteobacteria bacterium]|nr:ubiquinol-cytochrome c reductase iron-sulfur subunit [Gammaproteobacteria bacterium]